jgi:hypothetical protein
MAGGCVPGIGRLPAIDTLEGETEYWQVCEIQLGKPGN